MDNAFFERLKTEYPEFKFSIGKKFAFRPPKSIVLGPYEPFYELLALHELSHAILKHRSFKTDVGRLKMETEAWEMAKTLAKKYGIYIDEDFIQDQLDTYRDWLHQKSRCPVCGLTRFQTPGSQYRCPRCNELLNQIK